MNARICRASLVTTVGLFLFTGCVGTKRDRVGEVAWSRVTREHLMQSVQAAIELYDTQKATDSGRAKLLDRLVAFRDGGSFGVAVELANGETIFIIVCHPNIWSSESRTNGIQQIVCGPFCDPDTAVHVETDKELSARLLRLLNRVEDPNGNVGALDKVRKGLAGGKMAWK
jgi:hypothetical protein